jgi:hypothetical protein
MRLAPAALAAPLALRVLVAVTVAWSPVTRPRPRRRRRRRRRGLGSPQRRSPCAAPRRSLVERPSRRARTPARAPPQSVESGVGDEDRRVAPDAMPTMQREREVLQRRAAEEEQRSDRQQRDERRRQRAAIVSHSETFAIVANDARRISGMFSRMRSKMMIVS